MKKLTFLFILPLLVCGFYVGSVDTVHELRTIINPHGGMTNLFVKEINSIVSWSEGDATATNTLPDGPFDSIRGTGRWYPVIKAFGGTITNIQITTNITVVLPGATNYVELWMITNGVMQPVHLDLPLFWTNMVVLGPGMSNVLFRSDRDLTYAHTNLTFGTFFNVTGDGTNYAKYGQVGSIAKVIGPSAIYMQGVATNAKYFVVLDTDIRPSPDGSLSLGSTGGQWNSLYLTNQIVWGPGTTNVLLRDGSALLLQNTRGILGVTNSTAFIDLRLVTGTTPTIDASSPIYANQSLVTKDVQPAAGGTYRVGALNNSNGDFLYTYARSNVVRGFDDGAGNYSWMNLSHSGTNGAVIFNSQSAGTAGDPRPFLLQAGGTNLAYLLVNSGIGAGTPALMFTNNSAKTGEIGLNSGGSLSLSSSGTMVYINDNLSVTGDIVPDTDNTRSLGTTSSNGSWKDSYYKGEQHMVGENDGSGNYSWVRCFVTNGVAVFDFKNNGTGTPPTKFSFRTNGVEVGTFP